MPLLGPASAGPGFLIDRPSRLQLYLNAYWHLADMLIAAPNVRFRG